MPYNHSSNAVFAIARSMYGKRLTENDFRFLMECKDVSSIAVYLKNNTHYQKFMSNTIIKDIHRGKLESIIKDAYHDECCSLCRYEITIGDYFYKYIIDISEIDIILHFLTLLAIGKTNEYIYTMPVYMDKHSLVDIKALTGVRNYDEFLSLLKDSPYYNIFAENKPTGNTYNIAKIECELYNELYRSVFETIKKHTSGKEKKELVSIFTSILNAKNFDFIMRLKHFPSFSPDKIKELLCPFGSLKETQIDKIIDAKTNAEAVNILLSCSEGKDIAKLCNGNNEIFLQYMSDISKKNIKYSSYPSVVMISYLFLKEIELHNIFAIIEGVRYNVPPDVVKKLLIS